MEMKQLFKLSFIFAVHPFMYKLTFTVSILSFSIVFQIMYDFCVEQITQAFLSNQSGDGLDDIRVYIGPSRQFGQ